MYETFYADRPSLPSRWLAAQMQKSGIDIPFFWDYRLTKRLIEAGRRGEEPFMVRAAIKVQQMAQAGGEQARDAVESAEIGKVLSALDEEALRDYVESAASGAALAFTIGEFEIAEKLAKECAAR